MIVAPRSISGRIAVIAAVLVLLILIAAGVALSLYLRGILERGFDSRLIEVLDGVVAASEIDPDNGSLLVDRGAFFQPGFDSAGSSEGSDPFYFRPYWQIGRTTAEASRLLPDGLVMSHVWGQDWSLEIPETLGGELYTPLHQAGPEGQPLHVFARRIRLPGAEDWIAYAAAGDLRVVQDEMDRVNLVLVAGLLILAVLLVAAIFAQVRIGLRPLRAVGRRLADIRAGRTGRLEGDFPTEVAGLTDELNALLDYNKNLIERGRTQIGDLAHSLKTPLAVLTNEADKHPQVDAVLTQEQIGLMRDQIDRYLVRARMAAAKDLLGARTPVVPVAQSLKAALTRLHAERAISIDVEGEASLAFRGEREDLNEMLGNLLDNACLWAAGQVRLSVLRNGESLLVQVEDDGPGLPEDKREAVLARGERLDASVPGSGLGLAIVQEIAGAYGGAVALDRASLGGLRAQLTLPLAEGAP